MDYDKASHWDVSRALGKGMMKLVVNAAHYLSLLFQELKRLRRNARAGLRKPSVVVHFVNVVGS